MWENTCSKNVGEMAKCYKRQQQKAQVQHNSDSGQRLASQHYD